MAFAVGGGDAVKAVIRYSDHPAVARQLPIVGDAFALDFEAIARLKPDLVLVWTSGLNERHRARLRELGLTVYESEIRNAAAIARHAAPARHPARPRRRGRRRRRAFRARLAVAARAPCRQAAGARVLATLARSR